jgi:hypothetical protein
MASTNSMISRRVIDDALSLAPSRQQVGRKHPPLIVLRPRLILDHHELGHVAIGEIRERVAGARSMFHRGHIHAHLHLRQPLPRHLARIGQHQRRIGANFISALTALMPIHNPPGAPAALAHAQAEPVKLLVPAI